MAFKLFRQMFSPFKLLKLMFGDLKFSTMKLKLVITWTLFKI